MTDPTPPKLSTIAGYPRYLSARIAAWIGNVMSLVASVGSFGGSMLVTRLQRRFRVGTITLAGLALVCAAGVLVSLLAGLAMGVRRIDRLDSLTPVED